MLLSAHTRLSIYAIVLLAALLAWAAALTAYPTYPNNGAATSGSRQLAGGSDSLFMAHR